jgi:hypothetical protein
MGTLLEVNYPCDYYTGALLIKIRRLVGRTSKISQNLVKENNNKVYDG